MPSFGPTERRELEQAVARGVPPVCPICGVELRREPVTPPPEVSYVRRRVWLLCPVCRRSAAVDVKGAGRP